ncbi:hypothetical protein [Methylobacterium sp. OAE515]|uniref:hypothetical protein n=1 Tax=Methylobacterium sp. OAE515 TaxID=2817895 RepID=UPI00178BBB0B
MLGAIRGLMATVARARDDDLATLLAMPGANNVYAVSTNEGLIDLATGVNGIPAAITKPFSVRVIFGATPLGMAAAPLKLAIDGAAPAPVTRADGFPIVDNDVVVGRPYLLLGHSFTGAGGALSQICILDILPSEVTALAQGQIIASTPSIISAVLGAAVPRNGGTMTGDLTLQEAIPTLIFLSQGVLHAGWQLQPDKRLHWVNLDNGADYFSIGPDGSIATAQFGDLNTRIETRALANAQQQAFNYTNNCVQSMRYVYAGDMNTNYMPGTGTFIGAFGGYAMMCDHWTYDLGLGTGACADFSHRYRYLQMYIPSQGWVTVGAAS